MQYTAASNQVITNDGSADSKIYTDPIALGNSDRVSGIASVHYIYGSGAGLTMKTQVSNDGVHWVDMGIDTSGSPIQANGVSLITAQQVLGAFIRFEFDLDATATAAVCFDLHATLDHT